MKTQLLGNLVVGLASGLAAIVLTLSLKAGAVGSGVPDTVAYSGYLDLEGEPFDGVLDVRLSAYADEADADAVYAWEMPNVRFSAGRFTVVLPLGTGARAINAAGELIQSDPSVFIGAEIRYPGESAWISLQNRQQLQAVPYAVNARHSANFDVGGDLRVAGQVTLVTPLEAGNLAAGSVGADELAPAAVTATKLAPAAVTAAAVAAGAVGADALANNSVGLDELVGTPVPLYRAADGCNVDLQQELSLDASIECNTRVHDSSGCSTGFHRFYKCNGDVDPACHLSPYPCNDGVLAGYLVPPAAP